MNSPPQPGHVDSLLRMGIVSDRDYLVPWAENIGQFILIFGGIEFVTHKYLVLLEPDEAALEGHLELLLQQRIDRILELLGVATHLPQDGRELATRDWGEIKKMCLWRNHIAHNPVLTYWGWDENPEVDPPEGIIMPDLRKLKNGGGI
jgi:hypothetical protein